MGLYIVSRIVKEAGGKVSVTSDPAKTRFLRRRGDHFHILYNVVILYKYDPLVLFLGLFYHSGMLTSLSN